MSTSPEQLKQELQKINAIMLKAEDDFRTLLEKVHPSHEMSARNLLHYLVLRSLDIRKLQDSLHANGLSSLSSAESHVRGQLLEILNRLGIQKSNESNTCTYEASKRSMIEKSNALFGQKTRTTIPYIMVTFDKDLAKDYGRVKSFLQSGMNIARINCAHDNESTWYNMIEHVKRASAVTHLPCKIYMDLAGPKIRTTLNGKKRLKIKEGEIVYFVGSKSLNKKYKRAIGCSVQDIPGQLKPGETVLFDDGLIEMRVQKVEGKIAALQIVRISSKKPRLKPGKGINFPDSDLTFPAISNYDRKCLQFIKKNADMVGFSFVKNVSDIDNLVEQLGEDHNLSIILKIETPEAVRNFPQLLFRSMQEKNIGVMIARGDLAVEIGFERLSEVQEEILWICEAAHVPVIWATQVLESLNKSGIATRSEITDAAHAGFAECVMINKGTHMIRVIEALTDILQRSGGHHAKKRYTFRPLRIAKDFLKRGIVPANGLIKTPEMNELLSSINY